MKMEAFHYFLAKTGWKGFVHKQPVPGDVLFAADGFGWPIILHNESKALSAF